MVANLGGIGR